MGALLKLFAGRLLPGINGAGGLAAVGAGVWWFIGHRQDVVTLNYLELAGVVGIATLLMEWMRRAPPPMG